MSLQNGEKLCLSQGFEPLDQPAERTRQNNLEIKTVRCKKIDFPVFLKEPKNFTASCFRAAQKSTSLQSQNRFSGLFWYFKKFYESVDKTF